MVAKWMHVALPEKVKPKHPIDALLADGAKTAMKEIELPIDGFPIGKKIIDLDFPKTAIIAMIKRDEKYLTPNGATELEGGDVLIVLSDKEEGILLVEDCLKGEKVE